MAGHDGTLRLLIQVVLSGRGYQVTTASTVDDVVEELKTGPFDLAIVDVGMAAMEGVSLAREIRSRDPSLGLLMLVGRRAGALLADERRALDPVAFLHKPFGLPRLTGTIEEALASPWPANVAWQ